MRVRELIIKNLVKRPNMAPDYFADSVLDVNFKELKKIGIKHIIIDLDLTLRKKLEYNLEPKYSEFINTEIKKYSFESVSIATNNVLNIERYAKKLSANIFQPYFKGWRFIRKPSRHYYNKILKYLKAKPNECVMIGDKLRGDVYGGNVAGMVTVLVKAKGQDYWYDKILFTRIRESKILSKYYKKEN